MDLDQLIRDADPARGLDIDIPDPGPIAASRGKRRKTGVGGLVVATVAIAVAVAVAVVALSALRHTPGHTATAAHRGGASSRRQLLQTLAVLRTPQTHAALHGELSSAGGQPLPGFFRFTGTSALPCGEPGRIPPFCFVRLDRSLVRVVRIGRSGYRVWIFPATSTRADAFSPAGAVVAIVLHGPGIYAAGNAPPLTGISTLRAQGLLVTAYASAGVDRGVILVPDGVRKVALDDFRLITPKAEAIPNLTTSATVTDNLALLNLDALTISKLHLNPADPGTFSQGSGRLCRTTFAIYALKASAEMTWTETAGNLVRRRIDLYLYIGTHHPGPRATGPASPRCR